MLNTSRSKKGGSTAMGKKAIKEKKVKFVLDAPQANEVWLAGNFNNWKERTMPLRRDKRNRVWGINVALRPGRYEYKFVVDGNWISDPNNSNRIVNALGTENSIIEI